MVCACTTEGEEKGGNGQAIGDPATFFYFKTQIFKENIHGWTGCFEDDDPQRHHETGNEAIPISFQPVRKAKGTKIASQIVTEESEHPDHDARNNVKHPRRPEEDIIGRRKKLSHIHFTFTKCKR